jgi:hypothetical protein
MNQISILILTVAALGVGIIALCNEQSQHPFYLKIEVQYGK